MRFISSLVFQLPSPLSASLPVPVTQRLVVVWALCSGFANVTQPLSKCLQGIVSGNVLPSCSTDVNQTVLLLICYLHLKNFSCCSHRWRNRAPFGIHPDLPHQSAAGPGAGTSLHPPGTSCGSAELS